jgi:hypothetical protein
VEEQLQSALQDNGTKSSELCTPCDVNFDGGCRTAATPLPSKTQCQLSDCPQKGPAGDADRDFMVDKNYLGHLGTLSWVQRVCRPDLAHACGCLTRVGHNPGKAHWRLLQHCARYLHGTQGMGLAYERRSGASTTAMTPEGWTDPDFAPNYGDGHDNHRSISGHLFSYTTTHPPFMSCRLLPLQFVQNHQRRIPGSST